VSRVTVVVPLYNKAPYVQRALRSVLEQTYKYIEVVVIDDGSTDGGAEAVADFSDSRIRLIRQENAGVSAARNRGIREASGELVAFLDADDEWLPDFLATIEALRETFPRAGLYGTGFRSVYKDGTCKDSTLTDEAPMFLIDDYFKRGWSFLWTGSVAIPRIIFDAVGYFAEGEPAGEDTEMWERIALRFPVAYAAKALALYHQEAEGRACDQNNRSPRYPIFVRTIRQEMSFSQNSPAVGTTVLVYCNHILVDYAKRLVIAGLKVEGRRVLRQELFRAPRDCIEVFGILLMSYGVPVSLMRVFKRILRLFQD